MTVAELIAKLIEFDGDKTVYTYEEHGDYVKAVEVSEFITYTDEESEVSAVFIG